MSSIVRALSTSVAPIVGPPRYTVVFNKRSIFMSMIMFINVAIMPLKAYISEPFPWEPNEHLEFLATCSYNLTSCAPVAFDYFKNQSQNMSNAERYARGDSWDIFRFPLPNLPPRDSEPSSVLLELPYSIFYTQNQREQACQLVKREINFTEFKSIRADCFFGIIFDFALIWTESSDAMYCAFVRQTTSTAWLIFKWIYRCSLCIYIMITMWRRYYRHYFHLAKNLRLLGIEDAMPTDRIEIIMGDPTSIILLNPYVSFVFIVDIWVSIEFVTRAIFRLDQLQDIKLCLLACFYLSRMLWLAYGALILVSYTLKKLHKEKIFDEADPTLTALAVMITTGPITNLQSRILIFIDLYYYLFLPFSSDANSIEIALGVVMYALTIVMLPIGFGLLSKCCRCFNGQNTIVTKSYGSFMMNDIKHRFTNYFNLMTFTEPAPTIKGGTIHQLFARDRKYKRNLGMSQRGADCYLLFGLGKRYTSVRLSLLSCLDPDNVTSSTTDTTTAVGRIHFDNDKVKIVCGAYNSPWIA
ncbi:hypothetical protein THRCLA_23344 [Thraustotheca clavata]|uniref:Transmembrane protein n=1 Tax=Thraustotheca clavata TaxID=74557 RepID=A0A1V9Y758_9STRA|nr:hypothetical protein THRCLA_23344 [Thraustotheca clavata]